MSTSSLITLVAVHGNGGGGFRFARADEHVPGDVRFEAVTLPGFGGRPADPTLQQLPDYAEQLWREIEHLPRPLVVLGHGIGGSIALDMVQRHPVDGLILHAPVGTRLDRRWFPRLMRPEPIRRLIKWGISSRITRPVVGRRFFDPSVPDDYIGRFLDEYRRADSFSQMFDIITSDWWEGLRPVDLPALMLWGSQDRVLGADQLADYRVLLPRAATDVVPGWGHFPMVDDPETYATVVVDWARRLAAGTDAASAPLRVGSGLLDAAGVGPKATLLDAAVQGGLPVPSATVLPDGTDTVPAWLGRRVAVRSAFSSEDRSSASHAGRFRTVLDVDRDDPVAIADALEQVRSCADATVERTDVLVMTMVPAVVAGVAFTEPGYADDLVEHVDGLADDLLAGRRRGDLLRLPRLEPGERPDTALPGWQQRLARLLRSVRSRLDQTSEDGEGGEDGHGNRPLGWDVEWADDGTTCWLLQVRPITAPLLRDETFTIANHREILPDPPSVFMTSLIADASPELFDWYRRFDPSLPTHRHFIEVFDGRPLINLSLVTDFVRSLGLPSRLVTDSIGGTDEVGSGPRPIRLARRTPVLARLAVSQLGAVEFARRTAAELERISASPALSSTEAVDRGRRAYVAVVHAMTSLNTAASVPMALLRGLGVLEEHAARNETAASRMFRDLDGVRRSLGAGEDPTGSPALARWLDRYGHRGIYESDLARPRYVEDPTPIVAAVRSPPPIRTLPEKTLLGRLTVPLWLLARRPVTARETFRSDAMRTFLAIRRDLLRFAETVGVGTDDLWLLTTDEVRSLQHGWRPDDALLAGRRSDQQRRRTHPIPDVIRRFDPPETSHRETTPGRREFSGMGLVAGEISGTAWVLTEPEHRLPDGFDRAGTILIASSVDAGWLATFGQVAGVVIELGGDLSHGSIVLRELGLPAVTNAAGVARTARTGDRVTVDGRRGLVRLERA